jgi:hypothetical protein
VFPVVPGAKELTQDRADNTAEFEFFSHPKGQYDVGFLDVSRLDVPFAKIHNRHADARLGQNHT